MRGQKIKKYIIPVMVVFSIYPISAAVLISLGWLFDNQGLQLIIDELTRRQFILLFISDWAKSLPYILVLSCILYIIRNKNSNLIIKLISITMAFLFLFFSLVIQTHMIAALFLCTYIAVYFLSQSQYKNSK